MKTLEVKPLVLTGDDSIESLHLTADGVHLGTIYAPDDDFDTRYMLYCRTGESETIREFVCQSFVDGLKQAEAYTGAVASWDAVVIAVEADAAQMRLQAV